MPAHAVPASEEARAEDIVGAAARDRLENPGEVGWVVLPVAVDVDGGGVVLVAGDLDAGPNRGPEPARDRMRVDARAVLARDVGGGIARAVVDEQQVDGQAARLVWNPS